MRILTTLSAVAMLAAVAAPAIAADLPMPAFNKAPADGGAFTDLRKPIVTPTSWTGFYAGGTIGAAIGDSSFEATSAVPNFFSSFDMSGYNGTAAPQAFTGGLTAGYNYQIGGYVVGLEADLNYANLDASRSANAFYPVGVYTAYEMLNSKQSIGTYATLRPRLGFAVGDNLLTYVTGGLAGGQVKSSSSLVAGANDVAGPDYVFNGSKSDWRWGWTLGAGAEYALTKDITVKGEYLYVDLGSGSYTATSLQTPMAFNVKDDASMHVIRTGLNYRF